VAFLATGGFGTKARNIKLFYKDLTRVAAFGEKLSIFVAATDPPQPPPTPAATATPPSTARRAPRRGCGTRRRARRATGGRCRSWGPSPSSSGSSPT
jgi:hypothetical protein